MPECPSLAHSCRAANTAFCSLRWFQITSCGNVLDRVTAHSVLMSSLIAFMLELSRHAA